MGGGCPHTFLRPLCRAARDNKGFDCESLSKESVSAAVNHDAALLKLWTGAEGEAGHPAPCNRIHCRLMRLLYLPGNEPWSKLLEEHGTKSKKSLDSCDEIYGDMFAPGSQATHKVASPYSNTLGYKADAMDALLWPPPPAAITPRPPPAPKQPSCIHGEDGKCLGWVVLPPHPPPSPPPRSRLRQALTEGDGLAGQAVRHLEQVYLAAVEGLPRHAAPAREVPAEALQPAPDVEKAWNQDLGQEFEVVG